VQVAHAPLEVDELAHQQGTSVTQAWGVATELVSGVRLRDRRRSGRGHGAGEQTDAVRRAQGVCVEAQLGGQRRVQQQQLRVGRLLAAPGQGQLGQCVGEPVREGECRGDGHVPLLTHGPVRDAGSVDDDPTRCSPSL
jgi:hypothetical protein